MFRIEDDLHAEPMGEFQSREQAFARLKRLARIRWNKLPNIAPCTSWRECGRHYELVEFRMSPHYEEISRVRVLDISAAGVRWLVKE